MPAWPTIAQAPQPPLPSPPANGEKISATAQCVQTGSTLCVVSVSVTSTRAGEAKVCAIATVTLRVVGMA
ncbi:MAG: hypothetical protein EBT37_02600 [Betaproteobacteria bacterium]|nr:hypothetical protein [Betaproteobacteria bacterium]